MVSPYTISFKSRSTAFTLLKNSIQENIEFPLRCVPVGIQITADSIHVCFSQADIGQLDFSPCYLVVWDGDKTLELTAPTKCYLRYQHYRTF